MTRALLLLLMLLAIVSVKGRCQIIRIATVDLEYVYANLPSYKKLMTEIDSSSSRYQAVQKEKLVAYQPKLKLFSNSGNKRQNLF